MSVGWDKLAKGDLHIKYFVICRNVIVFVIEEIKNTVEIQRLNVPSTFKGQASLRLRKASSLVL
jgi:hypothetical protein